MAGAKVGTSEGTTRSLAEARGDASTLWLVISSAAGLLSMELPRKPEIVFGRDRASCDVVIQDDSVSRRHAAIRGGAIRDLESRNGTRVGGRYLEEGEEVAIDVGSVIEIGSALVLVQASRPAKAKARRAASSQADAPVVIDPAMRRLYALADVIGPSSLHVIILGETGTGKEVYAEALHAASKRADRAFLRVNCASLQGPLLESELFGYERGAFTGATTSKPGLLESADGGTVFLDEIGELPLETQAKLLRALESGDVTRLGAVNPLHVDVRYVAATHRDLALASREGTFRADLYFRLNGFSVTLAPLRRRRVEIVPLAEAILARLARQGGLPSAPRIKSAVRAMLEGYLWPGNVRELRNVVERAFVLARGGAEILPAHILLGEAETEPSQRRPEVLATLRDRDRVAQALEHAGGNQTAAAKALGVSRRALINRIAEYGLERPRKR